MASFTLAPGVDIVSARSGKINNIDFKIQTRQAADVVVGGSKAAIRGRQSEQFCSDAAQ